jgi:hypothetical protein
MTCRACRNVGWILIDRHAGEGGRSGAVSLELVPCNLADCPVHPPARSPPSASEASSGRSCATRTTGRSWRSPGSPNRHGDDCRPLGLRVGGRRRVYRTPGPRGRPLRAARQGPRPAAGELLRWFVYGSTPPFGGDISEDDGRFVQLRKYETGIAIRAGQVKTLFGAQMDSDGRHRSSSSISSMCLRHWKSAQVAPTANKMARATTISTPVTGRRFCPWRRRVPGRRRPSQAPVRDLVVARARTLFIIPPMDREEASARQVMRMRGRHYWSLSEPGAASRGVGPGRHLCPLHLCEIQRMFASLACISRTRPGRRPSPPSAASPPSTRHSWPPTRCGRPGNRPSAYGSRAAPPECGPTAGQRGSPPASGRRTDDHGAAKRSATR